MNDDAALFEALRRISTATVTTVLMGKGLGHVWMRGPKPLRTGTPRSVGRAFTLRFIPAREDVATPASWGSPKSTRMAIEAMPKGCIAVADTGSNTDAGAFGEILCSRMHARGVAALVTDGAMRDAAGISGSGLATWCNGAAAPASIWGVTFVGWQEPIGCGGVAVFPDDVIVADDDGAVVIPKAHVADVVKEGAEQERFETWIIGELKKGVKLTDLYPPTPETKARYEASKK